MKKNLVVSFLFVFMQLSVFSQLSIITNTVATTLAQDIVGPGVTITNASLTCPNGAAGTFNASGGATSMGISSGIILTTGSAVSAGMNETSFASVDNGTTFSDPALTSVESGAIYDPCILKFDFVPLCNTIDIKFVFGSEEYPTFVGSIDDAFGIFITGPNPAGGNYTNHNFATLPSGTPVTINNVNISTNSAYYHDNTVTSSPMYNYLAYGGYTSVITASVAVTPCQTYSMEVGIADAGDHIYDSGVFIQANSVSCTNTPTVTIASTAANCGPTGTASVTVTNYTGTPTYHWLPGNQTTAGVTGLTAGSYTCLVTLISGCGTTTYTETTTVASTGSSFTYTPYVHNPSCHNGSNGSVGVSISGGSAPYTYTWSTTPIQHTATTTASLPSGTYTVNITDNTGCTGSTTMTLANPVAITATVNTSPTTCTGSTGSATVTTSGLAPYTYTWSNSATTQTISNLAQGSYSVTLTDANTCTVTATGTVSTAGFTWVPSAAGTNPKCVGSSNGTATVSIAGAGANTFSYTWTPTSQTTAVATNLPAGSYVVQIKDNNGCTSTTTATLTNPAPLTATVNTSSTTCTGSTGSATVTNSGLAPYTYTWSNSGTTQTISNLAQGPYSVTLTDANTCTATATGTVGVQGFTWVPSAAGTNPKCFGSSDGTATVSIAGAGTNTFSYTWTPTSQTTAIATNLPAGSYVVQIQDNNGCTSTATATLTNPAPLTATVNTSPTTCTGSTGSATATCSGLAPYNYAWSTTPVQTSSVAVGLAQGPYTVVILDANTCTATATGSVSVQGYTWIPSVTGTNPKCVGSADGTATVSIAGAGANTFTYSWNTAPVQTTSVATTLSATSYVATVTDNNGCIGTASVTLVDPAPITATVNTTPTICTGSVGSATATCSGLAPYTYTWTTSANTSTVSGLPQGPCGVAITDANGCLATATGSVSATQAFAWVPSVTGTNPKCVGSSNGTATVNIANPGTNTFTYSWNTAPVQTTSVATTLSATSYVATVTDNNNCVSTASVTLVNPAPLTATVNTTPTICTGSVGSATATCSGLAPYTYVWTTSETTSSINDLPQGSCGVAITDANGCLVVGSGTVSSTGFTWTPVVTSSPTKCFGSSDGTATVSISNAGASTFTAYVWTPTAQTNSVAINLSQGSYIVTVTDNNGCVSTASATVSQPTPVSATAQATSAMCTSANGTATGFPGGGTPPYTYSWNATNPTQTGQTANGLAQGPYTVTVTDHNGCATTATTIVRDTTDLTVTASQSPDLCNKGVGKATATPTGQSPYTYTWTTMPIQNTKTADSLVVGSYSVSVTDANGCKDSASITVINHDDILASQLVILPEGDIYAENPVSLTISHNSGWNIDTAFIRDSTLTTNTGITGNPFSYVFPKYGDYSATYYYTSINGCKDTVTYEIIVKDYITLYIPNSFSPNGDGINENFAAAGTFVNTFEMYIYDRWGVLVTILDNINESWDGTKNGGPAPQDTYVYKGTAADMFGKSISFHGQINLIR